MYTAKSKTSEVSLYGAVLVACVAIVAGAVLFTSTAAADEHEDNMEYEVPTATEEPTEEDTQAVPGASEATGESLPQDPQTDSVPSEPAADVPATDEMEVNPISASENVPDVPVDTAAEASGQAEGNPMADTLSSVSDMVRGIETNVETGDMSEEEAATMITELQAVVDMIEASLSL